MNKRIIAPRKLLAMAYGAPLLTAAAAMLAIAVLTAPGDPQPSELDPQAAVLPSKEKRAPSPRFPPPVIEPQLSAQAIDGDAGEAPRMPQPTPEATPDPGIATAQPPIIRQPAAVDAPPPPPPAPTPVPTPTPVPGEYRPDVAEQLYTLLNDERISRGLAPVQRNSSLAGSAEYYARVIFLHDPYELNHWLDGGPGDRAWSRGYCCGVGEILVESEGSAQGMVDLWMNSAPHKAVILDAQYVSFGIACYSGPFVGDDDNLHHPIVCVGDFGSG